MFLEYPEFLSEQECDDISELITDREPWVLKNIPTTPKTLYKGLTSKYYDFNWLPWVVAVSYTHLTLPTIRLV